MKLNKLFVKVLMFLIIGSLISGSVFGATTVLYNHANDYTSITNNDVWNQGNTIHGGWDSITSSEFYETAQISSYSKNAKFELDTSPTLEIGDYYNITFKNYQTHERWNLIQFLDSDNLGYGWRYVTYTGTSYTGNTLYRLDTSPSTGTFLFESETFSTTATYKDVEILINGTHMKLTFDGVLIVDWYDMGRDLYSLKRIDVGGQFYGSGIGKIKDLKITLEIQQTTPTINHNTRDYYKKSSLVIKLNTTTNTNMSYSLDSGPETGIVNDSNSTTLILNSLSEGLHNIIYISTDDNGQTNTSANFTIDTTNPEINNSIPLEINSYEFSSDYFSCTDTNLLSCNISIDSLNKDSETNFDLTHKGNLSYTITAIDLAGNIATENGVLLVNPYQYFYFEDPSSNPISNFTFGGTTYNDYAAIKTYDLGLGNHTLEFVKYGYALTNIPLEFTSTSDINSTETIQVSLLYINIRNRQTEALITDTINFDLVGESYAAAYSTSTGLKTITDINELPGTYRLTFSGAGYATNDYYFQHTGFSSVNITTYMINESETIPIKIVLRDIYANPKSACVIKVKQYFISANDYLSVDMKTTNSLGEAIFDLEYAKWYQFVVECEGVTQTEPGQQITSTPLYLTWTEDETLTLFDGLPNLAYDPISWANTSNTTGYFRFEYNDLNNIVSQGCLYVYEKAFSGNILLGSSCVSSASPTINVDANYTQESGKTYIAKGFVTYEGQTHFVDEGSQTFMIGAGTWDYGLGLWGSMLLIGTLFLIGAALHPFAAIALAWLAAFVAVKFQMLPVSASALIGIGALILGLIIFRGKKGQ